MRRHSWLILSVGLNLLLAVAVWREWQRSPASGNRPLFSRTATRRATAPPPPARAAAPAPVEVAATLDWQQLEADDYRAFIAKLRAVGCPDMTIYDIISDEVDDDYNSKVKTVVDSVTGDFWNLLIAQKSLESTVKEKEEELRALRDQKSELMTALFGETNPAEKLAQSDSESSRIEAEKARTDFLPSNKLSEVVEIQNRFNEAVDALRRSGTTEWSKKYSEIENQRDRELKTALTPEEYAEYCLRQNNAGYVRENLAEFEGTEEEFRAIALAEMNHQDDGTIQKLLGPVRFAEYKRAQDNDYVQTVRVTRHFGLPEQTALQIYQLQQDALAQAKTISRDPFKSEAERRASLEMLKANTEQTINGILGPIIYPVFQEHADNMLLGIIRATP
jgi:hypothetical protein